MPYINLKNVDELNLEFHSGMLPKGEWKDHWRRRQTKCRELNLILSNSIGRSFNDVYHYLCRYKVHKNSQLKQYLRDMFQSNYRDYKIEDGVIVDNPPRYKKRSKLIVLTSDDFKEELLHITLNIRKEDCLPLVRSNTYSKYFSFYHTSHLPYLVYPKINLNNVSWRFKVDTIIEDIAIFKQKYGNIYYIFHQNEFVKKITQGKRIIFSSKNDPLYKRITSDKRKKEKAIIRISKIEQDKLKDINFKKILRTRALEQREL